MKKIPQIIKAHPYYFLLAAVIVVLVVILTLRSGEKPADGLVAEMRSVLTINVSERSRGALGIAVPTAGGNSFVIRAESAGRIEHVAKEGSSVTKGTILAQLDNSAQLAALTQAEGTYEAAVASAEQSGFSVESSQEDLTSSYNSANTTLRSTGITVQGVMESTVNGFFVDGTRQHLKLDNFFWEKKLLDYAMDDWNELTKNTISDNQIVSELETYIAINQRVADLLDNIYNNVLNAENGASADYKNTLNTYKSNLTTAKTTIASNLQTLKNTKLDVTEAEAALERARSSSLGGATSAEEARIKQALGSLQSARANYEKTIVRAPFNGTVVSLNVAVGDIINIGTDIAIIRPADGAETVKSFDLPISAIKYTPDNAYVFTVNEDGYLEAVSVETGLVTANTINVTGLNGDEVIVGDVRGLKAGEQVKIAG